MDKNAALLAFAALSQETRLDVFRLLIAAGPGGLLAGEIGERLGVRQNTMSANLAVLDRAGLVVNRREGRNVRYIADFDGIDGLLRFIIDDCCANTGCRCPEALGGVA